MCGLSKSAFVHGKEHHHITDIATANNQERSNVRFRYTLCYAEQQNTTMVKNPTKTKQGQQQNRAESLTHLLNECSKNSWPVERAGRNPQWGQSRKHCVIRKLLKQKPKVKWERGICRQLEHFWLGWERLELRSGWRLTTI